MSEQTREERQEAENRQKETDALAEKEQLIMDFRQCFSGPHGERVLEYLSGALFEKKTTHVRGDSYGSAFQEGKRFGIIEIRSYLEYDLTKLSNEPEEYKRV